MKKYHFHKILSSEINLLHWKEMGECRSENWVCHTTYDLLSNIYIASYSWYYCGCTQETHRSLSSWRLKSCSIYKEGGSWNGPPPAPTHCKMPNVMSEFLFILQAQLECDSVSPGCAGTPSSGRAASGTSSSGRQCRSSSENFRRGRKQPMGGRWLEFLSRWTLRNTCGRRDMERRTTTPCSDWLSVISQVCSGALEPVDRLCWNDWRLKQDDQKSVKENFITSMHYSWEHLSHV